jgi:hypothetical protein
MGTHGALTPSGEDTLPEFLIRNRVGSASPRAAPLTDVPRTVGSGWSRASTGKRGILLTCLRKSATRMHCATMLQWYPGDREEEG